jgi:hypothetical protein
MDEKQIAVLSNERKELTENVKKWVTLEKQLKIVNEKTRTMREMKHALSSEICNYMVTKQTNPGIIISDGELKLYDKKDYTPLSYGYIETCLSDIIRDADHVKYIMGYLKEKRDITISKDIRYVMKKS